MATNRLLTDKDRQLYKKLIDDMFVVCPDIMKRKIDRANVQQAFVLNYILERETGYYDPKTLSVGCFEDTAYEYLKRTRRDVVGIDPQINHNLGTHIMLLGFEPTYNIIFSTSVIEHVQYDEQFVADICELLKPGGIGILTMDFNNDYKVGDKLPATDLRFYTKYDLEVRLTNILANNNCELIDTPDWNGEPEFTHDECDYSFATFVFRKKPDVQNDNIL